MLKYSHRGTATEITNAAARIGGTIAPLISGYINGFMYLYSSISFVGFIISFWLIETRNLLMADGIHEKRKKYK